MRRRDRGAWPRRARRRSSGKAYLRRDLAWPDPLYPVRAERSEPLASQGCVHDELRDADRLTRRRERPQTFDAFVEQNAGAMKGAFAPVMEADSDLQDGVVQTAIRRSRRAPEELEGLVLFEELAAV